MPSRAIVVAVANQKGGVAKTTTVASLGAAWVELGHRVLMVDLDPQACLTFSLGYDPEDVAWTAPRHSGCWPPWRSPRRSKC